MVFGAGPKDADIMIIGEAPGEQEVRYKKPFCGPSGQLLDDLLRRQGILRGMCYITNVVKERPRSNNIKLFIDLSRKGLPGISPDYQKYEDSLIEEINLVNPNIIVAVGGVALWALCRQKGITKWRGSILESTLVPGKKVIPLIHPAAALRNYPWRHFISFDLKRIKKESVHPNLPKDNTEYYLRPTFNFAIEYLKSCAQQSIIGFDIETSRRSVSCISFARTGSDVISIPFYKGGNEYFTITQEAVIWREIAKLLANPKVEKIGQNVMFDTSFLSREYHITSYNLQDTMVAMGILYPDFPKNLGFITSIFTDMPYYKDEGKSVIRDQLKLFRSQVGSNWEERFWLYNARDSIVLTIAFPKMVDELIKTGNWVTYLEQVKLVQPLLYMTERGTRMDADGLKAQSDIATTTLEELEESLTALVGYELNPRSPKQLIDYFYGVKKIKPYLKAGRPTVDEKALKRMASKGVTEASLLLEHRRLTKLNGTYFKIVFDEDNRLRSSMNPVGTKTGRLSSSKTIYGTGANLQNQPPIMKRFMLPDEGFVAYNIDLSQAENRIVAYLGPDRNMMQAFASGKDIHSSTASLIFGIPYEDIRRMDKDDEKCPLGGGHFTHRFWGKKSNHALDYDLGYKSYALQLEILEKESKWIWEQYHKAYPGVRKYHKIVQAQLMKDRTLTNLFGRKYRFTDRWGDSLFKDAYAFIPQSTVADIINRRGINFIYYHTDLLLEPVEILAQVHDSIVFQIPKSVPFNETALILRLIVDSLETPLEWMGREFVIPAEVSVHTENFKDGRELGKISDLMLEEVVEKLQEAVNE